MREVLENGCEIIRGHGVKVGLIQTEEEGKREAYLFWIEGPGLHSERAWERCSRTEAIAQLNTWLGIVGLALDNGKIVEF